MESNVEGEAAALMGSISMFNREQRMEMLHSHEAKELGQVLSSVLWERFVST